MKRLVILLLIFVFLFSGCAQKEEPQPENIEAKQITLEALGQYPTLPTGCEVTAAATVLRFYGADITPLQFSEMYLAHNGDFYYADGVLRGPDPRKVFAGDPREKNSYGCFAPVITDAVNRISDFSAETLSGKSLPQICREYIDFDKPILIWVTMGMRPSEEGNSWITPSGEEFTWIAGEHCMVLFGYDEKYYYLADPQSGAEVLYKKQIVENRYFELGRQAVYIYPDA